MCTWERVCKHTLLCVLQYNYSFSSTQAWLLTLFSPTQNFCLCIHFYFFLKYSSFLTWIPGQVTYLPISPLFSFLTYTLYILIPFRYIFLLSTLFYFLFPLDSSLYPYICVTMLTVVVNRLLQFFRQINTFSCHQLSLGLCSHLPWGEIEYFFRCS